VFVTEPRCPFCQRELAPPSRSPIFDIRAGMSRAQRVALVAAVAGQTLLGCSDESGSGLQTGSGGMGDMQQGSGGTQTAGGGGQGSGGNGGVAQPVYGAPVTPGTPIPGTGGTGDEGTGGRMAVTHYGGIMPPEDAGKDAGSADAGDAGEAGGAGQDGGRAQAMYGAAIPPYGAPFPEK
jgi:hypothetical protein